MIDHLLHLPLQIESERTLDSRGKRRAKDQRRRCRQCKRSEQSEQFKSAWFCPGCSAIVGGEKKVFLCWDTGRGRQCWLEWHAAHGVHSLRPRQPLTTLSNSSTPKTPKPTPKPAVSR